MAAPASHRAPVNWLPDLPATQRRYGPFVTRVIQTSRVPLQTQPFDHRTYLVFQVCGQVLVVDRQQAVIAEVRPVLHKTLITLIIIANILNPVSIKISSREILEIYRQTGIDRVPATVDDSRFWKQKPNKPDVQEIGRVFVGDMPDISATFPQVL